MVILPSCNKSYIPTQPFGMSKMFCVFDFPEAMDGGRSKNNYNIYIGSCIYSFNLLQHLIKCQVSSLLLDQAFRSSANRQKAYEFVYECYLIYSTFSIKFITLRTELMTKIKKEQTEVYCLSYI